MTLKGNRSIFEGAASCVVYFIFVHQYLLSSVIALIKWAGISSVLLEKRRPGNEANCYSSRVQLNYVSFDGS